jgi:hypothetical protein
MNPQAQKAIIPYDLESLKGSIEKHEANIVSMETAIKSERQAIADEREMIDTLQVRQAQLNG